MKRCPKCQIEHVNQGTYCSRKCANSRQWTEYDKIKKSQSAKNSDKVKQSFKKENLDFARQCRNFEKIEWTCIVCNKIMYLTPAGARNRKFCSGTCRNIHNNKLIFGTRSKAELFLESKLTELGIEFIHNDRKLLNGKELDFYLPYFNIAIEWNGIYHYKDVHKKGHLSKIQESDEFKKNECERKGILLLVVKDLNSNIKEINLLIEKVIYNIRASATGSQIVSKTISV